MLPSPPTKGVSLNTNQQVISPPSGNDGLFLDCAANLGGSQVVCCVGQCSFFFFAEQSFSLRARSFLNASPPPIEIIQINANISPTGFFGRGGLVNKNAPVIFIAGCFVKIKKEN